jgi:hypothetical protein
MATKFFTDGEIADIRSTNRIPDNAIIREAPDGVIVFCSPAVTEQRLGFSNIVPGTVYDMKQFLNVSGVYFVAQPVIDKSQAIPTPAENPPPPSALIAGQLILRVGLTIGRLHAPEASNFTVTLDVQPGTPIFANDVINTNWNLNIQTIPVPVTNGVINAIRRFTNGKIPSYFDQDRIGKTLLNLGGDYQVPMVNWKYDDTDQSKATIFVKLYRPLENRVAKQSSAWISRELSPTLVDTIHVVFIPGAGKALYLRPPNKQIEVRNLHGNQVNNVTLQTLFTTSSFDVANPSDPIMDSWFVTSLEGAELNLDYSDFSNFVFYSSATGRIEAFKNKLVLIEDYNRVITDQSASLASIATSSQDFTSSMVYTALQNIVTQRNDVVRSFDGYERYLYYGSGSAYSSSFSGNEEDALYWLQDATWPKVSGSIMSVASASNANLYGVTSTQFSPATLSTNVINSWLGIIESIATQYDIQNRLRLVNALPEYLVNDNQSQDFLTFMDMVGHHFDTLKVYADAMPDIYDRNSNPTIGMSPDVVWNIAEAFGITLPNQYAVKNLVDYTIGAIGTVDPRVYRTVAAETWKRFLHNQMYLLKTKGTKNALTGLLNVYGVLPTSIQIRETATPSFYTTQSYETIEEQTNTLYLNGSSFVTIPFSSSAQSVQTRVSTVTTTAQTIVNAGNSWSIRTIPLSSSYGSFGFYSGSTLAASSSIFQIFNGNYYNVTAQLGVDNLVHLWTLRANDAGDILDSSHVSASAAASGIWHSGSNLYLGSSGSGTPMVGNVDEFRLWSEPLSSSVLNMHAQYPALYNGNTSTSALNNLLVRLSFGIPINLGIAPKMLTNESPYIRQHATVTSLLNLSASNFTNAATYPYSMEIVTRNILRYTPNVGGSQFVSNKIQIADAPVLRYFADDSGSNIPILAHDRSIVQLDEKFDDVRSTNTIGFYFSLTDAINDSIIRSVGNIDIQDYIGDPSNLYKTNYPDLVDLNLLYWTYYAYTYNYNEFVEFVDTLLQPLFIQARELVPARAKLLTGIVLESPILERNKIQYNKIDVSGYDTFNTVDTPTLYPDALTTKAQTLGGDVPIYDAIVVAELDSTLESVVNDLASQIDTSTLVPQGFMDNLDAILTAPTDAISADTELFSASLEPMTAGQFTTDIESIDDEMAILNYVNFLLQRFGASSITNVPPGYASAFNQLLTTYTPKSRVPVQTGMNPDVGSNLLITVIDPTVNYDDISSTDYFGRKQGLYQIVVQNKVRYNQKILTDAGTWLKGAVYSPNQYIIQSGQTGSAAVGNGREYVNVSSVPSGSFYSYNPPSLDTENWRRMTYIYVNVGIIKLATQLSDGLVHFVNSGSAYSAFTGYAASHYRFFEDVHLATLRHKRLGCKQSNDTTFDGGPAVEIIRSSGDILVVSTGAEPIQRTNDNAGPILTVQ